MQRYTFQLGPVPVLLVSREHPARAAERGTVLFMHGLGANKEINQPELERFADAGFLAIGIDAVGHGERRYPDFDSRFAEHSPTREPRMIETIVESVRELPDLVELLRGAGLALPGRVGFCGVSMGGFVGYGAAPSGCFDALAALIATPAWMVDVPEHPARHLDAFFPCAVLTQIAGQDHLVRAEDVRSFHAELAPYYAPAPERLSLIEYPQSGHFMREEDWHAALAAAIQWFERML